MTHIFYSSLFQVPSTMSVESALQQLASYRLKNTRESQDTFEKGLIILKSRKVAKLGDERMHAILFP